MTPAGVGRTHWCQTLVLAAAFLAGGPTRAAEVYYGYDSAGRLALVNYGNGTGIRYSYDPAGNLIARRVGAMPPAPRITQLSPASGPVGTAVTIVGANFETTSEVRFGAGIVTNVTIAANRLVAVVPPGATSGRVQVTASGGTALSVGVFMVTAPVSETPLTIAAGGAASTATIGPSLPIRSGYATASVLSGPTPYGTAVFSFSQGGVVVSEVGVAAAPPTTAARISVEHRPSVASRGGTVSVFTGFAAVNTGGAMANMNLRLRDPQGATQATGALQLAAGAHLARFFDQLAPDFVLPADFASTGFGSMEITSDQPVSLMALRLTTNQRGDLLLTNTPIADLVQAPPAGPQAFAQVADGGGYEMTLVFLNTASAVETGTLRFLDDDGGPLAVVLADTTARVTEVPYAIPAGGLLRLATDGSPGSVNQGWAQLVPSAGTPAPVGAGVFSFGRGGNLVTETSVPAATPTTRALVYVDTSGGHDTGLALANPGIGPLRLMMRALQTDGRTPAGDGPATVDLAPGAHTARFAGQLISGLPEEFVGVLEISSSSEFAALTLRSLINARGDFLLATFPIADGTRPAPSPIVFPQIVNGDGYQTQFVFLTPAGVASSVTLRFFGSDGAPIDIGRGAGERSP